MSKYSEYVFLLQDPNLLEGRVTLHHVKAGSVVARQGDQVRTPTYKSRFTSQFHDTKVLAKWFSHFLNLRK